VLDRLRHPRPAVPLEASLLALVLAAGLVLRLRHNDYGLPYSYVADENTHFTVHAARMFDEGPNPGYFRNPSAFTYLLHGLLRLGALGPLSGVADAPDPYRAFLLDPTPFFVTGRTLAALLCAVAVVAVYAVGRRLWGTREGLVAAAALAFAFLPVAYSRMALTDTGALIGVPIALLGAVRALEGGRLRAFALSGAGAGVAIGFKYTSGSVLLALLVAAIVALRRRPARWRRTLVGLAVGAVVAALVFTLTTPFFFADLGASLDNLANQAEIIAGQQKVGQGAGSGFAYYLDTLGWGFGIAAGVAALAGAVVLLRRDPARAAVVLVFPVFLLVYLSSQARFFARYLLPIYPVLALLCGVALVAAVDLLRVGTRARVAALVLLTLLVVAQPLAADVRTMRLLGREHTLSAARQHLARSYPRGTRVELPQGATRTDRIVSQSWYLDTHGDRRVRRFPEDPQLTANRLKPGHVDRFRRTGFCLVMTTSLDEGRARASGRPEARAYYDRLARESRVVFVADPFEPGAARPPFHYDRSYLYASPAYERPGPLVRMRRLDRCA